MKIKSYSMLSGHPQRSSVSPQQEVTVMLQHLPVNISDEVNCTMNNIVSLICFCPANSGADGEVSQSHSSEILVQVKLIIF